MFTVHPLHAFNDNYIWLLGRSDRREVAVVDPGDAAPVLEAVQTQGLRPVAVLITHHHADHTGGISRLQQHFELPVFGPAQERIAGLTHPVSEGDCVELDTLDMRFRVLDTPGHTRGHVCYYGHGALFSGDTLFTAGCGRLFEGSPEQMHASLQKLATLPEETLVYCAHEYTLANLEFARVAEADNPAIQARQASARRLRAAGEPTVPAPLGEEKQTNPFLRCEQPALIAAAERFAGRRLATGAEVFAVVRHWKDTLD